MLLRQGGRCPQSRRLRDRMPLRCRHRHSKGAGVQRQAPATSNGAGNSTVEEGAKQALSGGRKATEVAAETDVSVKETTHPKGEGNNLHPKGESIDATNFKH